MSNKKKMTVTKEESSVLEDRKALWYTISEIRSSDICPCCGINTDKFKKSLLAHVKRCFSIKKLGPVYRLHGYVECKCGYLIADTPKAQKLHVCMGEVPAFKPDLSYEPKKIAPTFHKKRERPQSKIWIRNFVSPFKLDTENNKIGPKTEHRVRNFEMSCNQQVPQNASVYSISSKNGTILVTGQTAESVNSSLITIKKSLRLPRLKENTFS